MELSVVHMYEIIDLVHVTVATLARLGARDELYVWGMLVWK